MASYLDFAMMCHSYNFISIRRFINMCPLPLFCFNDRKSKVRIKNSRRNTEDTDRNKDNTEEKQKK